MSVPKVFRKSRAKRGVAQRNDGDTLLAVDFLNFRGVKLSGKPDPLGNAQNIEIIKIILIIKIIFVIISLIVEVKIKQKNVCHLNKNTYLCPNKSHEKLLYQALFFLRT